MRITTSHLCNSARDLAFDFRTAAYELDKHTRNVNIARVTGSSMALAGGITAIIGFILIPFTFGLSALVASLTGTSIATVGGLTAGGANVAKIFIEKFKKKPLVARWNEFMENLRRELQERNPEAYQRMAEDVRGRVGEAAGHGSAVAGAVEGAAAAARVGALSVSVLAVQAAAAARLVTAMGSVSIALNGMLMNVSLYDIISDSLELYRKTGSKPGNYLRQLATSLEEFACTGEIPAL